MRTRNNRVSIYLNDKEMDTFKKKVESTGLNYSTYLRHLIEGYGPTPSPDPRFWECMNMISEFSLKVDDIALKGDNRENIIALLDEGKAWRSLRNEIERNYIRPKKIDTKKILKDAMKNGN